VLATQCVATEPLRVRRIAVGGSLRAGVYAKDVILEIIRRLGVQGGVGYAYEYAGDTIARMSMDERMTICNMSIEGGARVGYVNPDATTFRYLEGREFAPRGDAFDAACRWWASMASDPDARYDDEVRIDAAAIEPARVRLKLKDGRTIEAAADTIKGSTQEPMSEGELMAKFRSCLEFGLGASRAQTDRLAEVVSNLENCTDAAGEIVAAFPGS